MSISFVIFLMVLGAIFFYKLQDKSEPYTQIDWFTFAVLFISICFYREYVLDYLIGSKLLLADVLLAIVLIVIFWRLKKHNIMKVSLFIPLTMLFIFFLLSAAVCKNTIGGSEGLLTFLRFKIYHYVFFLFFAGFEPSRKNLLLFIKILLCCCLVLVIYANLGPFFIKDSEGMGILNDSASGGINRFGAYILVPIACLMPCLYYLIKQPFIKQYQQYILLILIVGFLSILLSFSKSTIGSLLLTWFIFIFVAKRMGKPVNILKQFNISSILGIGFILIIFSLITSELLGSESFFSLMSERVDSGIKEFGLHGDEEMGWRGFEVVVGFSGLQSYPWFGKGYDYDLWKNVGALVSLQSGYNPKDGMNEVVHTGTAIWMWQGGIIGILLFLNILRQLLKKAGQISKIRKISFFDVGLVTFAFSWIFSMLFLNDFNQTSGSIYFGFMFGFASFVLSYMYNNNEPLLQNSTQMGMKIT